MAESESPEDNERMADCGRLASEVLDFIAPPFRPGVTDRKERLVPRPHGQAQGRCRALNYARPATARSQSICTRSTHQVCHGVPRRVLSRAHPQLYVTVITDGYPGDLQPLSCRRAGIQAKRLVDVHFRVHVVGMPPGPSRRAPRTSARQPAHAEEERLLGVRDSAPRHRRKFTRRPSPAYARPAPAAVEPALPSPSSR